MAEQETHSFIVKIWCEEPPWEAGGFLWRGHVTHVPDGERQYVRDLDGITVFISRYLQQMEAATQP